GGLLDTLDVFGEVGRKVGLCILWSVDQRDCFGANRACEVQQAELCCVAAQAFDGGEPVGGDGDTGDVLVRPGVFVFDGRADDIRDSRPVCAERFDIGCIVGELFCVGFHLILKQSAGGVLG